MRDWQKIVGGNVRRLRHAHGRTQEQLAFEAKIDVTYLRGIEAGRRNPSLLVLMRILERLGERPAVLFRER